MATSVNAELCALAGPRDPYPETFGVVQADALADLLLVDGNPLQDLELVAGPERNFLPIIKNGEVVKLDPALAAPSQDGNRRSVAPFRTRPRPYSELISSFGVHIVDVEAQADERTVRLHVETNRGGYCGHVIVSYM